ncbi:MAG TPA: nitrate ABC transporter ATP-binding protein [Syntrophomonas sp.]|jgi:ABC-type nitrate/sulfonate/bicarbonate transport system ATPase subunit|nr:nitrate ABC transporter ATP-binding protein [Bacillota bacterium]HBQ86880.1 nitrate ABC transporter ATP-binding protein [Syntrophomonas sp.]
MADDGSLIQIEALNKTFISERGNEVPALSDNSFNIKENDFVCIVGPSGCGKSTLLRIVAGLETSSSGRVLFKGQPHDKPTQKIGMVFQQYSLLPWRTVEENIVLGMEFRKEGKRTKVACADRYLKLIGMENFRHAYPYELSGGMQQRVAIVRALANDPEVLLMDEPFGALDAHTRIIMQRELLRIWEQNKKTVLFVTHSVDEAIYLADRIVVMTARPGTVKEIMEVNIPRPRSRANSLYGQMADEILRMLEVEDTILD